MEIKELYSKRKGFYTNFLDLIECEDDFENNLQSFIDLCERERIKEKKEEFLFIINFILKISDNHYRNKNFSIKLKKYCYISKIQSKKKHFQILNSIKNAKITREFFHFFIKRKSLNLMIKYYKI